MNTPDWLDRAFDLLLVVALLALLYVVALWAIPRLAVQLT